MATKQELEQRIAKALQQIERYGMIDGAHHKQWLLDQVVRELTGDGYQRWLDAMSSDPEYAPWDTGIAP